MYESVTSVVVNVHVCSVAREEVTQLYFYISKLWWWCLVIPGNLGSVDFTTYLVPTTRLTIETLSQSPVRQ